MNSIRSAAKLGKGIRYWLVMALLPLTVLIGLAIVVSPTTHAQDSIEDLTNDCIIAPIDFNEVPGPAQYQYDVPDNCFQDFPTSESTPEGETSGTGDSPSAAVAVSAVEGSSSEVAAVDSVDSANASVAGGLTVLPDTGDLSGRSH